MRLAERVQERIDGASKAIWWRDVDPAIVTPALAITDVVEDDWERLLTAVRQYTAGGSDSMLAYQEIVSVLECWGTEDCVREGRKPLLEIMAAFAAVEPHLAAVEPVEPWKIVEPIDMPHRTDQFSPIPEFADTADFYGSWHHWGLDILATAYAVLWGLGAELSKQDNAVGWVRAVFLERENLDCRFDFIWKEGFADTLRKHIMRECAAVHGVWPKSCAPAETRSEEPEFAMRFDGDHWHIAYGDEQGFVTDSKGAQHVVTLLDRPGRAIPCDILHGGSERTLKENAPEISQGDALEELAILRDQLADISQAMEDSPHEVLPEDREAKEAILTRVRELTGLGGKARQKGTADSARTAVQRAVKRFLTACRKKRLDAFADHLEAKLELGANPVYNGGFDWKIQK